MRHLLWVGSGGFAGAVGRYLLSGWVHRLLSAAQFPWGTLAVNVVGCLLIGLLAGLSDARQLFSPDARLFLLIGCLGGFTTFSTFSYETLGLAREHGLAGVRDRHRQRGGPERSARVAFRHSG